MKIHLIYKITNLINNKVYIGQTLNPSKRWSQHKIESKKDLPLMVINLAMKKYEINNFIFEIIASCRNIDDANFTEELIINQEKSHVSYGGYNVSGGGFNFPKSEETKAKLSKSLKGKPKSESHRNKIRNKKNSEETRLKISDGNKGKIVSQETRKKISDSRKGIPSAMKNKHHSEESKNKISDGNKGKKMSEEAVNKTSIANKTKLIGNKNSLGHVCSEEAKKKMSEARKGKKFPRKNNANPVIDINHEAKN